MKKVVILTLAIVMMVTMTFTIAACGEAEPETTPTPETAAEATPTPTPTPTPEPEAELAEEQQEADDNPFEFFAFPFEFAFVDVHGNTITNNDLGEKRAFLFYAWETWCPSCTAAMPALAQLSQEFGDEIGFISIFNPSTQQEVNHARMMASYYEFSADFHMLQLLLIPPEFDSGEDWVNSMVPLLDWIESISTGFIPNYAVITANDEFPGSIGWIDEAVAAVRQVATGGHGGEHSDIAQETPPPPDEPVEVDLSGQAISGIDITNMINSGEIPANTTHLHLRMTGVADLTPLSGLVHLQWLDILGTPVNSLTPLHGLTSLEFIWLGSNPQLTQQDVDDLSAALPNLQISMPMPLN